MNEVPLVITDEAAAHIAQREMQQELEHMLDWVRQHVISLQGIRVEMSGRHFLPGLPRFVFIRAYQDLPAEGAPPDMVELDWGRWVTQTFPAKVCTSITLVCRYEPFVLEKAA